MLWTALDISWTFYNLFYLCFEHYFGMLWTAFNVLVSFYDLFLNISCWTCLSIVWVMKFSWTSYDLSLNMNRSVLEHLVMLLYIVEHFFIGLPSFVLAVFKHFMLSTTVFFYLSLPSICCCVLSLWLPLSNQFWTAFIRLPFLSFFMHMSCLVLTEYTSTQSMMIRTR